jgi:hypothetical protein
MGRCNVRLADHTPGIWKSWPPSGSKSDSACSRQPRISIRSWPARGPIPAIRIGSCCPRFVIPRIQVKYAQHPSLQQILRQISAKKGNRMED